MNVGPNERHNTDLASKYLSALVLKEQLELTRLISRNSRKPI